MFQGVVCCEKYGRWAAIEPLKLGRVEIYTSRRATNNDAPDTLVNASESASAGKPLRGLQSGFDGVNGEEQKVDGSAGQTPGLNGKCKAVPRGNMAVQ